ncbi:hypothetical protein M758_UG209700 [Ceratodon purpureus]|nr:hypothetical protein M758_UG209700 [Ceratodon purpureus]
MTTRIESHRNMSKIRNRRVVFCSIIINHQHHNYTCPKSQGVPHERSRLSADVKRASLDLGMKITRLTFSHRDLTFLFCVVISNVKVPQLIHVPILVGRNHSKPIPHIVFLQVLLGQVFQVSLGESALGGDADAVLLPSDGDGAAEHSGLAIDFDAVVKELLEGGDVHDLVLYRLTAVDGEGLRLLLALRNSGRLPGSDSVRHWRGREVLKLEPKGWSCERRKQPGQNARCERKNHKTLLSADVKKPLQP